MTEKSLLRSGRRVKRSQSFESEFPTAKLGQSKKKEYTVRVPIPTDEDVIKHHSVYCYRCNEKGNYDGPLDVPLGPEPKRCRLLFCKSCSYSIHNNCLPSATSSYFNAGEMTCVKCQRNTDCIECKKNIDKTNPKEMSFRCNFCYRGFHEKCIKKGVSSSLAYKVDDLNLDKLYKSGTCVECDTFGETPATILAERKINDKTEFLIKWKNVSYRHTNWVTESWMQGAQSSAHRAYLKKAMNGPILPNNEIPVEWTIVDRILSVEWENNQKIKPKRILAVFKDTSYEDGIYMFI